MKLNHASKPLLALLSLSLIFTGSAAANAADYPPVPGQIEPPAPGEKAKIIEEKPPLDDKSKVVIPKAPESTEVLIIKVVVPNNANIATLNDKNSKVAVQVTSGVVLGGIVGNEDVAKVKVDSKSKTTTVCPALYPPNEITVGVPAGA